MYDFLLNPGSYMHTDTTNTIEKPVLVGRSNRENRESE